MGAVQQPPAPLTLAREPPAHRRPGAEARRCRQHGVELEAAAFAPRCVRRSQPAIRSRRPSRATGLFVVQDEASQLVAGSSAPAPASACSTPAPPRAEKRPRWLRRWAIEGSSWRPTSRAPGRSARSDRSLRRARNRVRVVQADAAAAALSPQVFDCVLLDAPCSGLGTLRRDPDIKWRRTRTNCRRLPRAQLAMLNAAASVVRPGGRLVYATCSSEPEENEEVVAAFLARGRVPGQSRRRPRWPARIRPMAGPAGYMRTLPHRTGSRRSSAPCSRVTGSGD